jgi:hypothetical protein
MATPEQRGATAKLSNTARQQVSAVPDRAHCGDKEIPIKGGHVEEGKWYIIHWHPKRSENAIWHVMLVEVLMSKLPFTVTMIKENPMRKMREHCDMCHQCNDDSRIKQKVRDKWKSGIVE